MSVFAGRFRVVAALGAGGMGAVYEAEDLETGGRVALKLAHGSLLTDAEALRRFEREARMLRALDHPNVVRVVANGEYHGRPFLAMELVPGETLGAQIRRGPLSPAALAPILRAVAFGVDAVHRAGIVHRDLKPSNILLPADGSDAKIADFGIAKDLGASKLTVSGNVVGTPRYLAPELLRGSDPDPRSDVYALGVVSYEALSAHSPLPRDVDAFTAIARGQLVPLREVAIVPVEVEAVVSRAMAPNPKGRFASMVALAEAWDDALMAASARGEDTASAAVRPGSRSVPSSPPTAPLRTQPANAPPTERSPAPFTDDSTPRD